MNIKFKNHLISLLLQDDRLRDEQGELKGNLVKEFANTIDEKLITLLLGDEQCRDTFFLKIKDAYVFKTNEFKFFLEDNSIDNSFTQYSNRIGLSSGGKFFKDNTDVVLNFPFKDCILEGGQSTEDGLDTYFEYDDAEEDYTEKQSKRKEIFFNEVLAKDEIDRLLEPKAFTKITKYDSKGESKPTQFNRNEKGTITDNLIIKGNNLLALHALKQEFKGKVKLIYIDPPYNTGNDSFAYNDNFNHSTWLTFMRNRLMVARDLLREDGTIAISIDHNEVAYVLALLDELFSNENKKNIISIKRSSVSGAKVINPGVVNVSEFLLLYSKNTKNWKPNKVFKAKARDNRYNNFIVNIEDDCEKWVYSSVLDAFSKHLDIPKNKLKKELGAEYDIKLEDFFYSNKEKIIRFAGLDDKSISAGVKEVKYQSKDDNTKTYLFKRENFKDYYLYKGNAILFFKDRLIKIDDKWHFGEMISDIWDDVLPNDIHNEGSVTLRKGKKPEKLISRLIELLLDDDDIVLDYHLGSGTTAAVAHKMNRQYIGLEQLDYGDNDSTKRLQNVINNDQSGISKTVNWKGGGSFTYLELAKNNQTAKEEILKCNSYDELMQYFETMYTQYFLHYNVRIKEFKEVISQEENFKNLALDRQKEIFAKMLDLNQLYVNLSEMEDSRYKLDAKDIALSKDFYQIK
ncbi:site-specific DNA-methyltransferase [Tenacibaculum haliotis]|uniref:site-specific DNA-methyltransferase n=1 Tax=Tenacibaculum haliotis TaxID=1888914 RepID=UPI0021AE57C1|nr:site-specific DNA-methyltransferase [Tenacibaculum haliotis]MCT4698546.1 site-specific DNA-methyltransferase [Tenacibaculum haliotis]